jgi:hypothetical protein
VCADDDLSRGFPRNHANDVWLFFVWNRVVLDVAGCATRGLKLLSKVSASFGLGGLRGIQSLLYLFWRKFLELDLSVCKRSREHDDGDPSRLRKRSHRT